MSSTRNGERTRGQGRRHGRERLRRVPRAARLWLGLARLSSFDTATRNLTWTVTYSGLSGPAAGAHFHGPGEAGKNAGIVLPFQSPTSPIKGSQTLTEAQTADLLAGKWYVNVHTAANPGGEIRGQMVK